MPKCTFTSDTRALSGGLTQVSLAPIYPHCNAQNSAATSKAARMSPCVVSQAGLNYLEHSVQEDGSGCEGQSSCTVLAPSAKRIKMDYRATMTSPILESAYSFESTAPHAHKGVLDVVGDNGRHLGLSAGDAEMTDGDDEGGKPQVRDCTVSGSAHIPLTVFGVQICRDGGCNEQGCVQQTIRHSMLL